MDILRVLFDTRAGATAIGSVARRITRTLKRLAEALHGRMHINIAAR